MPNKTQRFDPRQNMNGSTYEIFHYLDIKTRHLDAHYHDFYEIFFFLDGDVDYWIDGSLYHLKPGDVLLINPTELHKPVPRTETENYERIVLWINKNYLSEIEGGILEKCFDTESETYSKILRLNSKEKNQMILLTKQFVSEYYGDEFAGECCTFGLLLQTMSFINRVSLSRDATTTKKYTSSTFIAEVLSYIGEHFCDKLSLDELSAHFFINKYYLSHEFKRAVGTSLHRYITLKRLNKAYNLLEEGTSPSQTSILCGFGDYTNFFRAFKAEYGISPAEIHRK